VKSKLSITLILICVVQISRIFGQPNPDSFFVKNVSLDTDPNPRFVWTYIDTIVSWYYKTNNNEISCLKKELMKTGIFSSIEPRLSETPEIDTFNLLLTIKYNSPDTIYKIGKIRISGFTQVDKSKFDWSLATENLVGTSVSLKTGYYDFEEKISELLDKSLRDKEEHTEIDSPWFSFKVNKNNELELSIIPKFKGCAENSK
jgi:hypothetical protein